MVSPPGSYYTLVCNYSFFLFGANNSLIVSLQLAGPLIISIVLIGNLCPVALAISYGSTLRVVIMLFITLVSSYSINRINTLQRFMLLFLLPLWVICILAEIHRAPFDFNESESELVSGYSTKYSSANFAFVLLSEYLVLLFSCIIISHTFFLQQK